MNAQRRAKRLARLAAIRRSIPPGSTPGGPEDPAWKRYARELTASLAIPRYTKRKPKPTPGGTPGAPKQAAAPRPRRRKKRRRRYTEPRWLNPLLFE
jgi:hypothetical protein